LVAASPDEILDFWFADALDSSEAAERRVPVWFGSDEGFDREIRDRFGELPDLAHAGGLDGWRGDPRSALALVIVLDQFSRNLHRSSSRSFRCDDRALEVAREAIAAGFEAELHPLEAVFLYLPFEHAESLAHQDRCVELYERLAARAPAGLEARFEGFCEYARRHREVIRRFGRFPHRNPVLGREPTPEEAAYLDGGGDTFGG
jgi:uncharacterized protein (DUF924 family)